MWGMAGCEQKEARLAAAQRTLAAEKEAKEEKPAHPFKKMMMSAIKEEEKANEGKRDEVKVEVKVAEAAEAAAAAAVVPKTMGISIQKKRASQVRKRRGMQRFSHHHGLFCPPLLQVNTEHMY
jgi:hypothetical protein